MVVKITAFRNTINRNSLGIVSNGFIVAYRYKFHFHLYPAFLTFRLKQWPTRGAKYVRVAAFFFSLYKTRRTFTAYSL